MSVSLSYPVSALKASKTRSQVLILEPDLAVLVYLRLTLGDRYALGLFSEEQSLLDRLERGDEPDLLLLALHSGRDPMPLLTHIRCAKPQLPVIVGVETVTLTLAPPLIEIDGATVSTVSVWTAVA